VFDPGKNILLSQGNSLPARTLWLLYPRTAEIQFEGKAAKMDECTHPLPWGWADFQGEAWDLSRATKLTLHRDGKEIFTIPIRPDEASQRPHLVGGNLFIAPSSDAPTPTYTGSPPAVRIPLVGRTSLIEELDRWRLTLRHPFAAEPRVDLPPNVPLTNLRRHLIQKDGFVELPLNIPELLGDAPTGSYTLRLRGPLGRDAELSLRLLSHFSVTGHENIYLPHPEDGSGEIKLLIETSPKMTIEYQAEDVEQGQVNLLEQQPDYSMYEVIVPPEAVETQLIVVQSTAEDKPIHVPVRIPLRRLRWTLASGPAQTTSLHLERTGWMIKQSLEVLEQSQSPVLFVGYGQTVQTTDPETEFPEPESLNLSLVDLDDQRLMDLPVTKRHQSHGRSVWRFDLAPFLDTIRHSSSPVVRFELEYPHPDGPKRLPVLSLTRSMIVSNVSLEAASTAEGQLEINLTWLEDVRLRNRRVRFWPLWRPWLSPYEVIIPDETESALTFQASAANLPVGAYLVEFLVVDPWVGTTGQEKPVAGSSNTTLIEMISPDERLTQIDKALKSQEAKAKPSLLSKLIGRFTRPSEVAQPATAASADYEAKVYDLVLERAQILFLNKSFDETRGDIQLCFEGLNEASFTQILTLANLVEQSHDQRLLTSLQLKMFAPGLLERLLDHRRAGELTPTQYQAYLAHLPRSSLLPLRTCQVLLEVDDDKIKMYAVLQLVQRGDALGVSTILDLVQHRILSYANASEILKLNVDFAVGHLEQQLDNPAAVQLIEKISPNQSAVVRVGHWVRSRAGWGQIARIETLKGEQSFDYFIKGQINLRLYVILRPRYDAMKIVLELREADIHVVQFKNEPLYSCNRKNCNFITPDQRLLMGEHYRLAHGGISGAGLEILHKTRIFAKQPLTYQIRAPNILT
jgi:hypothetical protein